MFINEHIFVLANYRYNFSMLNISHYLNNKLSLICPRCLRELAVLTRCNDWVAHQRWLA